MIQSPQLEKIGISVSLISNLSPFNLSLLLLFIGDSVGQGRVDHGLHPDVAPDTDTNTNQHNAKNLK